MIWKIAIVLALASGQALAGEQRYEKLAASVQTALAAAISERARARAEPRFESVLHKVDWLAQMSNRLPRQWLPGHTQRVEFLTHLRYEAQRAGLDPSLVLGLIQVESNFRRYAVSSAGARGFMQVMPFWAKLIGNGDSALLFDTVTNLRFGCIILRYYLDRENGNLFRALGRYNGSLGRADYPNKVLRAWQRWRYEAPNSIEMGGGADPSGAQRPPIS